MPRGQKLVAQMVGKKREEGKADIRGASRCMGPCGERKDGPAARDDLRRGRHPHHHRRRHRESIVVHNYRGTGAGHSRSGGINTSRPGAGQADRRELAGQEGHSTTRRPGYQRKRRNEGPAIGKDLRGHHRAVRRIVFSAGPVQDEMMINF